MGVAAPLHPPGGEEGGGPVVAIKRSIRLGRRFWRPLPSHKLVELAVHKAAVEKEAMRLNGG